VGRHAPRGRRARRALVAGVVVAALAGAATAVAVTRPQALDVVLDRVAGSATRSAPDCTPTVVRLDASPEINPALREALAGQQGRQLADGTCLQVDVRGVTSDQAAATLRSAGARPAADQVSALPDLWVPDASLWTGRLPEGAPVTVEASLARSPVVLATSRSVVSALGWTAERPPAWAQAVTGAHPVEADLASDTCGLATALALRTTLGGGKPFRRALAALSLAVDRGTLPGATSGLELAATDSPQTPLVPMSEQSLIGLRAEGRSSLAAVYPADGSPVLDYPLVRVAAQQRPAATQAATAAVVSTLRSPATAEVLLARRFRLPDGRVPAAEDLPEGLLRGLPYPSPEQVAQVVAGLPRLAAPTRMLAVIDVSTSMEREVAPGVRRIDLVVQASSNALGLFPGDDSVGTWVFASRLDGAVDHVEIAPIERLDRPDPAGTHRDRLQADLQRLPTLLSDNGTSIYDTMTAAVASMQATYDGRAENVVVLLTDGVNTDSEGLTLDQAVQRLRAGRSEGDVRIVAIGIGPETDQASLQRLAGATDDGQAYLAAEPEDLGEVLVDALSSRD
jgi:Ca-activated chloride channel homolog